MARPSKFNEDSVGRFLELVASGCTVRDAARDIGVSEMTINRWRKANENFREAVLVAMREGWDYTADLKASGFRTYRNSKKAYERLDLSSLPEKAHTRAPEVSQMQVSAYHQQEFVAGLPVKPRPHTLDYDVPPFVNPDTWMVERIEKGVLRVCPIWVWEKKNNVENFAPFIGEWI